jgi:hypothetical protein
MRSVCEAERSATEPTLTDPDSRYERQPLDQGDVDRALQCLLDRGPIHGVDVDRAVLLHAELTDKGIDCAEQFGAR